MGSLGRVLVIWALASACLESPDPRSPGDLCGTLSSLSDEFEGGLTPWTWYADGLWAAESDAIRLTPSPGTLSAIYSEGAWMVEGGQLTVELGLSQMAPDSRVTVLLYGAEGEVNLSLDSNRLQLSVYQDGFEGTVQSVAVDPTMRFWRIGRAGGRMQWAISTNGESWLEQDEFDAALAGLAEVGIVHSAGGTSSVIAVEAINPGPQSQPTCPLYSLRDDFSRTNPRWFIETEEFCDVRVGDHLELGVSVPEACGLVSKERLALADSQVSVELAEAGDCRLNPMLQLRLDVMSADFGCRTGSPPVLVAAAYGVDWGEDVAAATFDAEAHRFIRVRHAPAEGLVFEFSPDRSGWNRFGVWDELDGVDLTSVELALMIYTDDPMDDVVAFDELNTGP